MDAFLEGSWGLVHEPRKCHHVEPLCPVFEGFAFRVKALEDNFFCFFVIADLISRWCRSEQNLLSFLRRSPGWGGHDASFPLGHSAFCGVGTAIHLVDDRACYGAINIG